MKKSILWCNRVFLEPPAVVSTRPPKKLGASCASFASDKSIPVQISRFKNTKHKKSIPTFCARITPLIPSLYRHFRKTSFNIHRAKHHSCPFTLTFDLNSKDTRYVIDAGNDESSTPSGLVRYHILLAELFVAQVFHQELTRRYLRGCL